MKLDKLASRKLIITILAVALLVLSLVFNLPLGEGVQDGIIALVIGYVGAQGLVDAAKGFGVDRAPGDEQ